MFTYANIFDIHIRNSFSLIMTNILIHLKEYVAHTHTCNMMHMPCMCIKLKLPHNMLYSLIKITFVLRWSRGKPCYNNESFLSDPTQHLHFGISFSPLLYVSVCPRFVIPPWLLLSYDMMTRKHLSFIQFMYSLCVCQKFQVMHDWAIGIRG